MKISLDAKPIEDICPHCKTPITPENKSQWAGVVADSKQQEVWKSFCIDCENIVGNCNGCQRVIMQNDRHIFKKINDEEMMLLCGVCESGSIKQ